MAIYFDSTQAPNYVMVLGSDGLQNIGSLPTASVVQLSAQSQTSYIIIPLNTNIAPYGPVAVDFTQCIPAISPLPTTPEEKLAEMCKIFPTVSSAVSNVVTNAYQTQQIGQLTTNTRNYYASLNGTFVVNGQAAADCFLPEGTIKGVMFNVYTNTASVHTTVDLIVNNVAVATVDVLPTATGIFDMGTLSIAVTSTDTIRLGIYTLAGTGSLYLSPITTTYIST